MKMLLYAVKKRLLVPRWLLQGYLFEHFPQLIAGSCEQHFSIISTAELHSGLPIVHLFKIWHHLICKCLEQKQSDNFIIIKLNELFPFENSQDLLMTAEKINQYFCQPWILKNYQKQSDHTESKPPKETSHIIFNGIISCQIQKQENEISIKMEFYNSLISFCTANEKFNFAVISLNPDIISSAAKTKNLKSLLGYLSIEYFKKDSSINHISFTAENLKIIEELIKKSQKYYDHGILAWNREIPQVPIKTIKKQEQAQGKEPLFFWKLSEQCLESFSFEKNLPIQKTQKNADTLKTILIPNKASSNQIQDHDFLTQVARFYESLNPSQKRAFDRQRSNMSIDEFKQYVDPVIKKFQENSKQKKMNKNHTMI